jgi:ABC-2 type transport system permease protein
VVADNAEIAAAVQQELARPKPPASTDLSQKPQPETRYMVEINTTPTEDERNFLRQQVSNGAIDGFLWLTDDSLAQRKVIYNAKDVTDFEESTELRNAVRTALITRQLGQKGMSQQEVESLLKPIELDAVHVEKGREGLSGVAVFVTTFIMVMLLYTVVLIYGIAVMRSIIEEKSSRILEVLLSSVTARELLAGKILGVGAVSLTQILIWVTFAALVSFPGLVAAHSFISGVHIPMAGIIAFGVFFLLGYFLYSTMYAAVGAMVNTDQEAQQMQWPAMLPIIMSLVLMNPVLQHPNSALAFWLSIIPFFAPILMLVRVLVEQPPAWQLALCVALMLVTIYGLLSLTSRIYRVGILMYGKRPTLPELRRWLKYAG